VFENQLLDSTKIMCTHSSITRQANGWIEPELTFTLRSTDVDVCWLVALIGIKMKPERSYSQDCRHENESSTYRQPCDTFLPNVRTQPQPPTKSNEEHRGDRSGANGRNPRAGRLLAVVIFSARTCSLAIYLHLDLRLRHDLIAKLHCDAANGKAALAGVGPCNIDGHIFFRLIVGLRRLRSLIQRRWDSRCRVNPGPSNQVLCKLTVLLHQLQDSHIYQVSTLVFLLCDGRLGRIRCGN
jgi:hypothetical protein